MIGITHATPGDATFSPEGAAAWAEAHAIILGGPALIGKTDAGDGPAVEIPLPLGVALGGTGAQTFTAGAVLLGNGANAIAEDPTQLFWDTANHRLGVGTDAPQYGLEVLGRATIRGNHTYDWTVGNKPDSGAALQVGMHDTTNPVGVIITSPSGASGTIQYLGIYDVFGTTQFRVLSSGIEIGGANRLSCGPGFIGGSPLNTSGLNAITAFGVQLATTSALVISDTRVAPITERGAADVALLRFGTSSVLGGGTQASNLACGGIDVMSDGTNRGLIVKSYDGANYVENFRILDDGTMRITGTVQLGGAQILTSRQTGWGAPTGTATRTTFDTGSVTLSGLAERVKALIDDITTHGLIGA